MRRLPAALLAAVTLAPVVIAVAQAPGAQAVGGPVIARPAVVGPKPVATTVHEIPLTGVDPSAATALSAAGAPGRGAPGAMARMATRAPAVLTAPTGTAGFQTLGVTWRATTSEPDLLISVRTRSAKGWSGWSALDDDAGDDPTVTAVGKTAVGKAAVGKAAVGKATGKGVAGGRTPSAGVPVRGGTDPLWVGPSTGVQVRIVVRSGIRPADLKLELIDPGTSAHDAVAAPTAAGAAGTASLGVASANKPAVFSRLQWGADEGRVRDAPTYMPTITGAVLHHTAGMNNYAPAQVPSIIRGDYAYHLSRGWSDIGYNALVDRFGRIWEGRAGGLDRAVMGAHAGGFNYETFGVSVLGNYDVSRPTAASVAAVARVMAWKLDLDHRDPFGRTKLTSAGGGTARYRAGRTVSLPVIMGHRNTGFTACPGRYLYPYLGSIRRQVRTLMKASLLDPSGPPASVPRGRAMSITARALAAQTWRLDVEAPFGGGSVAQVSGSAPAGQKITATWNGKLANGTLARPGRYRLTLSSSSSAGTARPVIKDVLVVPPVPAAEVPAVPLAGSGGYHPVTPTRLLDTRTGGRIGLGPQGRADIRVLGVAGVPVVGVSAVVLNVTADGVSDDTALTVWPTGRPSGRRLTGVPAGQSRSILVTTRIGGAGSVSVGNAVGVAEVTVDVVGYFGPGGAAVQAITPVRIYNSRADVADPLVGDAPRLVPLPATVGGIAAAQITGLIVDLSALSPSGPGRLTVYSPGAGGDLPSLVYRARESIDNLAFVPVVGGVIAVRATGAPVNATLDVRGVLLGPTPVGAPVAGFTAVPPVQLVDTRQSGGPIRFDRPRDLRVTGVQTGVPIDAAAVVLDLTAIAPAARTWLQVHATGQTDAYGTTLRVAKGDTRGNLLVVPIGPGGMITVGNARGQAQVRIDVYGYLGR